MKKRSSGAVIAVIAMICILCMSMIVSTSPVKAEGETQKGSVNIYTADFAVGTGLGACEAGVYENGKYILNDNFKDCQVDLTDLGEASKAIEAAETLTNRAMELDSYTVTAVDEDGYAFFRSLDAENRLYVIFQISNFDTVSVSPILVVLPYYTDNDEMVLDVNINAKVEDIRIVEPKGSIILSKINPFGLPLEGAEFRLEVKRYAADEADAPEGTELYPEDDVFYYWETIAPALTSDRNGKIVVKDIPLGIYRFVETKAPEGYILAEKAVEVVLDAEGTVKLVGDVYVPDEGEVYEFEFENSPIESSEPESSPESSIESSVPESSEPSQPNPSEPETHTGEDISKFIIVGCVVGGSLVVVIIILILTRKKKK